MPTPRAVKRSDGTLRWRVQYRETPGATPTSETFDTPEAAQRYIDAGAELGWVEARRLRYGMRDDGALPTLATWFDTHMAALAGSATPGTIYSYRGEARRTWLPRLGRYPLDMISRDMVVAWVAWQRRQETHRSAQRRAAAIKAGQAPPPAEAVAPKTIANAQRLLSSVLQAASERYGTPNVARGIPLPSDAEPAEMVFLTPAEYAAIYTATPMQWRPLVALLAGTGARWGEATALRRRDFDLDADVPSVRISRAWKKGDGDVPYLGSTKSRRGRRTVSLSMTTVAAIRAAVEAVGEDHLVFTAQEGGRLRPQNFHPRIWRPAIAASGVRKHPRVHDLRHSHASWLIAQGVPLPIIQQRLGHESIKTTVDRYGHIMPDAQAVAAEAVERAMGDFDTSLAIEARIVG